MSARIAVIGGGAAGLAAAIACGEEAGAAAEVVIFEADERVGRKILATGNGRCNFSNSHIDARVYRNPEFVRAAFDALGAQPQSVLQFFSQHGLLWHEEAEGRLYPLTNKASTVVDVLRASVAACGVREACGHGVVAVEPPAEPGKKFTLRMDDGAFERADAVIVACGGVHASLLPANFSWQPPQPVLGALKADVHDAKALDGVRLRCSVSLLRGLQNELVAQEDGEVLFRKYGVSGIAVFNLSRFVQKGDVLSLDLFPNHSVESLSEFLVTRAADLRKIGLAQTCAEVLRGMLLPVVSRVVLKRAGLAEENPCSETALNALARCLKSLQFGVEGMGDIRNAQVARGGFAISHFNPATMEAYDQPNLFVVGEALDVDAPCGGYNLHWAWTSGVLAGKAAAAVLNA